MISGGQPCVIWFGVESKSACHAISGHQTRSVFDPITSSLKMMSVRLWVRLRRMSLVYRSLLSKISVPQRFSIRHGHFTDKMTQGHPGGFEFDPM